MPSAAVEPQTSATQSRAAKLLRSLTMPALWAVLLFASAGTAHWLRGWICLAAYVISMTAIGVLLHRANPDLEQERTKWNRPDTKRFDRVFLALFIPLSLVQPAIAGLDAVRFRWTEIPLFGVVAGIASFSLAMVLIASALIANRHAETTVRIQSERAHTVVSSGPYRLVRHPMYLGMLLMYPATALILGSAWALGVSGVMLPLVIWRTAMEDRTLRRELPGYQEFTESTRFRLVPGLW